MSKVSIKVGPKTYSIITADGEEDKIVALGQLIDGKYQMLGHARSVQETDNLVFAALFLADELEETRKTIAEAQIAAESAQREAATLREEMDKRVEAALARAGGQSESLSTEVETLRKAEERAREENKALKAELAAMREASRQQHDLFVGGEAADDSFAEKLEALAARAEQIAATLESDDDLEAGGAAD